MLAKFKPCKQKMKRVQVHLWVDVKSHAAAKKLSKEYGISLAEFIRQAIDFAVKNVED